MKPWAAPWRRRQYHLATLRANWRRVTQKHVWSLLGIIAGLLVVVVQALIAGKLDSLQSLWPIAAGFAIGFVPEQIKRLRTKYYQTPKRIAALRQRLFSKTHSNHEVVYELRDIGWPQPLPKDMAKRHYPDDHPMIAQRRLNNTNLAKCNLSRLDLSHSDFSFADLRGAEMQDANFSNSVFAFASLSGAQAALARFRFSNFNATDLSEANLFHTDLHGIVMLMTNLRGANLDGSGMVNATITHAYVDERTTLPDGRKGADWRQTTDDGTEICVDWSVYTKPPSGVSSDPFGTRHPPPYRGMFQAINPGDHLPE